MNLPLRMAVTLALAAGAVMGLQALWLGWIMPSAAAEATLPQIELTMTPDPRIAHGLHMSLDR